MHRNENISKEKIYTMDLSSVWDVICKVVLSLCIFMGAYLAPVYAKGIAIMIFMLIDTITGLWASSKNGIPFQQKKLKRIVSKFIGYGIALVVALVFTKEFGVDILTIVAFGLASLEVTSIFDNLYKITHINFLQWIEEKLKSTSAEISKKNQPK